jgi:hypothetical protein
MVLSTSFVDHFGDASMKLYKHERADGAMTSSFALESNQLHNHMHTYKDMNTR